MRKSPNQIEINSLLISYKSGNLVVAEDIARKFTKKYPAHPIGWKVIGAVFQGLGKITESLKAKQTTVQLDPLDPEAHCNLGNTLKELGRLEEAEQSYRNAIHLKPDYYKAFNYLGNTLTELGKPEISIDYFGKAIVLMPAYAEAYLNLGNAFKVLGRNVEAEQSYKEALRISPDFIQAHFNLGLLLINLDRLYEAAGELREVIRINPGYADAYFGMGNVFFGLKQWPEAEENYRQAIFYKKDYAEASYNLANLLKERGRLFEAEDLYKQTILMRPDYAEAYCNLGNALKDCGRFDEAEESFRKAIQLKPELIEAHSSLLFCLNYTDFNFSENSLAIAKNLGRMVSERAIPKFTSWNNVQKFSKLKLGFVSGDLRNHPVGYFVESLVSELDKNQFELYAFPTVSNVDDLTSRIKKHFNEWIPIYGKSDFEAAQIINNSKVHVLIDLSGHTANNRLPVFSYKPAPIQASWLGYFATTGIPEIDYFIGDPFLSPQNENHHFTEKIIKLPNTWLCLTPPKNISKTDDQPASKNKYFTFGNFSNLSKINERVIDAWAKVLEQVPNSKLLIKSKQLSELRVRFELEKRFVAKNIPNDRLILESASSRENYFEAYNRIDMVLDSFPYPGGTTSVDALWMGVQVLTLKGNRFLSHLGESIASNAGQQNWIAESLDEYIEKAIKYSSNIIELHKKRNALKVDIINTPLFDSRLFAKGFGEMLLRMWDEKIENEHEL